MTTAFTTVGWASVNMRECMRKEYFGKSHKVFNFLRILWYMGYACLKIYTYLYICIYTYIDKCTFVYVYIFGYGTYALRQWTRADIGQWGDIINAWTPSTFTALAGNSSWLQSLLVAVSWCFMHVCAWCWWGFSLMFVTFWPRLCHLKSSTPP